VSVTGQHYIAGNWLAGTGEAFASKDPATGETLWQGAVAGKPEIDTAVTAARQAGPAWASVPLSQRAAVLEVFAAQLRAHKPELAEIIARETGKPLWESLTEVDSMIAKVPVSLKAYHERRAETAVEAAGGSAITRYKPHGVVAVFGPFNFPGHLPNGHIVPALLAGNTVVFKPSELTPWVAQRTVELWRAAGSPSGVLNLLHGGRTTGAALAAHPGLDGILFTGSAGAGQALHRLFAGAPQKILALEMGGNNPLIVWQTGDLDAVAYHTVQSAFLTSGQRCSCARRLIVSTGPDGDRFVERLTALMAKIRIGAWSDKPEPFMGPVITAEAAGRLLATQQQMIANGGEAVIAMRQVGSSAAMLSPGLIDMSGARTREDVEHFGPLLQLIRVADFDAAIREANNTSFGLCAGLLSDRRELYERFYRDIRAGVVNWNRPTTGASSSLPFGGVGLSGNHRPSAYFAADYCSDPIACLETPRLAMPTQLTPGIML
jgi:succinylglutamic semialdehyde dehydrogenase